MIYRIFIENFDRKNHYIDSVIIVRRITGSGLQTSKWIVDNPPFVGDFNLTDTEVGDITRELKRINAEFTTSASDAAYATLLGISVVHIAYLMNKSVIENDE